MAAVALRECAWIREYTGLDQHKILALPLDLYMLNLKEAFIYKQNKTKEGREYLKKAYRLKQTDADLDKIRNMKNYKSSN